MSDTESREKPQQDLSDGASGRVDADVRSRTRNEKQLQNTKDWDKLYAQAREVDPQLRKMTEKGAQDTGGRPELPKDLKDRKRAMEKASADKQHGAASVTDLSRSTIVYKNPQDMYRGLEKLNKEHKFDRVKDRYNKPTESGYRDILINKRMPNGHVVEMQLTTENLHRAKQGKGHGLYEKERVIREAAQRENRPFTKGETKQLNNLQRQSQRLYNGAFKQDLQAGRKTETPTNRRGNPAQSEGHARTGSRRDAAKPKSEAKATQATKPASAAKPGGTTTPATTKASAATKTPTATKPPGAAKTPAANKTPSAATTGAATKTPSASKPPASTKSPGAAQAPSTAKPASGAKPAGPAPAPKAPVAKAAPAPAPRARGR